MENAWKRFEHTGRVSDYLEYVSQNRTVETGLECGGSVDTGRNAVAVESRAVKVTQDKGKAGGTGGTIN